MKTVEIKKAPKMTVILYMCGALMILCTMFIIYKSNAYISGLVAQGFDTSKERIEVINYYLVAVAPFVFYTISLFSLGHIAQMIGKVIKEQEARIKAIEWIDTKSENEDDEIDEFFTNI